MESDFSYVWDIMVVALFLGAASLLERYVPLFKKYFIPTAIVAGFIGLLAGPQMLNLVPFSGDHLSVIVYHLMSVAFIALALKRPKREKSTEAVKTGLFIVSGYVVQGLVGFGLSLFLTYTFFPRLFPAFGMLLPLGYGQGAAQAFSMGRQWEADGFANGGNIGLSVAALGLLWSCIGGIPLMNYLIRVKKILPARSGGASRSAPAPKETEEEEVSAESFTTQLVLIGVIYLLTYLTIAGLSALLSRAGTFGQTFSNMLWGFSFIVGTVLALLFRAGYDLLLSKKLVKKEIASNFLLDRISGGTFDFMIAASIAAISVTVLREYIVPTLIIGTIGGFVTIWYTVFVCRRIYRTDTLENILTLYGTLTGIVSTGLALVKEIDPDLESTAPRNVVLGSGTGLFIGLPLMLLLGVPIVGIVAHRPILYLYTMLALAAYLVVLLLLMFLRRPKAAGGDENPGL